MGCHKLIQYLLHKARKAFVEPFIALVKKAVLRDQPRNV